MFSLGIVKEVSAANTYKFLFYNYEGSITRLDSDNYGS